MKSKRSIKFISAGEGPERALAITRAVTLCAELGNQWLPRVWYNFGWHYCALIDGAVRIEVHAEHRSVMTKYTAFLYRTWTGTSASPQEAIVEARKVAQLELDELSHAVTLIDAAVTS